MVQTSPKHQENPSKYLIYRPLLQIITNRPPCIYLYIYHAPCCSPEDCMKDLDLARPEAPSVMVVDAGDVFVGGRYHSLVPILREVGC